MSVVDLIKRIRRSAIATLMGLVLEMEIAFGSPLELKAPLRLPARQKELAEGPQD